MSGIFKKIQGRVRSSFIGERVNEDGDADIRNEGESESEEESDSDPDSEEESKNEEFYLDDNQLTSKLLEYNKSVKRQNQRYDKIEKVYYKRVKVLECIDILRTIKSSDEKFGTIMDDKRWKREMMRRGIHKELAKLKGDTEGSSGKGLKLERKHQKLIVSHKILQGEFEELKKSFDELKNRYDGLIEDRPESNGSVVGITSSFGSQNVLRGLKIGRQLKSSEDGNGDYSFDSGYE